MHSVPAGSHFGEVSDPEWPRERLHPLSCRHLVGAGFAAVVVAITIAAVLLLEGAVAPLGIPQRRAAGLAGLIALTFLASSGRHRRRSRWAAILVGIGGMAVLIIGRTTGTWLLAVAATAAGLEALALAQWPIGLAAACTLHAWVTQSLVWSLPGGFPAILSLCQRLSPALAADPSASPTRLGPTILGLEPLLLGCLVIIGLGLAARRRLQAVVVLTILVLAWFALARSLIPSLLPAPERPTIDAICEFPAWVAALVIAGAASSAALWFREIPPAGPRSHPSPRAARVGALVLGVLCFFSGWSFCPGGDAIGASTRRVQFYNSGGFDWERPQFGGQGPGSYGMFGLLPEYLAADGFEVGVLAAGELPAVRSGRPGTLVLINCPEVWDGDRKAALVAFVRSGGSLLVLGDHTDVFGLQRGFNSMLDCIGVEFDFDSAYPRRPGWHGCVESGGHPLAAFTRADQLGVAIGAGLTLRGRALPVAIGRFGFSDTGIRSNTIGAFLGNYSPDPGEPIGDCVLMASAILGRGKVLVFGDTSMFQNSSLSDQYAGQIKGVFEWLSRPVGLLERWPVRAALLFVSSVLAILLAARLVRRLALLVASTALLGALTGERLAVVRFAGPPRWPDRAALIDYSHAPDTGHHEVRANSQGAAYGLFARAELLNYDFTRWPDREALLGVRALAILAPSVPFSASEAEDVHLFMESGGVVLLEAGFRRRHLLQPLLLPLGLDLGSEPLGPLPRVRGRETDRATPRFPDAWPIVRLRNDPADVILFSQGNDVCALFRPVGPGGILLFSDDRFFAAFNVEDQELRWEGNLALLEAIARAWLIREGPSGARFPEPRAPPED